MDKKPHLSAPLPVRRWRKQEWVSALAHAASIVSNDNARVNPSPRATAQHPARHPLLRVRRYFGAAGPSLVAALSAYRRGQVGSLPVVSP